MTLRAEIRKTPLLVGVRHILDVEDQDWLLREDVHRGLRVLEEEDKVFDCLVRPPTLKHVATIGENIMHLILWGRAYYADSMAHCADIMKSGRAYSQLNLNLFTRNFCLDFSLLDLDILQNVKNRLGFSLVDAKYVLQYIDLSNGSLAFPKRISAPCSTLLMSIV